RRPRHHRVDGGGRCLRHGNIRARARGDADRRQYHCRPAARRRRSARPPRRGRQPMTEIADQPAVPGSGPRDAELATPAAPPVIATRFDHGSETYLALVWRRFRRSVMGMTGLVLTVLLLLMAVFG